MKLQPLDSPPPPPPPPEPSLGRGMGLLSDHGEAGQGDSTLAFLLTLPDSHLCLDSQPSPSNPTVCLSVHLCTCKPVCVYPWVYASMCLRICVSEHLCVCPSVHLCVCVSVHLCPLCVCASVHLCVCAFMHLCVWLPVCLCICKAGGLA